MMQIHAPLVFWIVDNLSGQPQYVRLQSCMSDTVVNNTEAPQGAAHICSPFTPRISPTTPSLPPARSSQTTLQLLAASARGWRLSTGALWTLRSWWWTSAGGKHPIHQFPSRGRCGHCTGLQVPGSTSGQQLDWARNSGCDVLPVCGSQCHLLYCCVLEQQGVGSRRQQNQQDHRKAGSIGGVKLDSLVVVSESRMNHGQ